METEWLRMMETIAKELELRYQIHSLFTKIPQTLKYQFHHCFKKRIGDETLCLYLLPLYEKE